MNQFKNVIRFGLGAAWPILALSFLGATTAVAQDKNEMVKSALSAAPPAIAKTAKVMTMQGEVLKDGPGTFTCFPYEGAGTSPMCLDAEWLRWADAWMNKKDFKATQVGLAYMLAGDMPDGGASNIDPFAKAATADNQWVVEGPHVMILSPDPALLGNMTTDPNAGVPYVMWKDTPYVHIMMPTGSRPQ